MSDLGYVVDTSSRPDHTLLTFKDASLSPTRPSRRSPQIRPSPPPRRLLRTSPALLTRSELLSSQVCHQPRFKLSRRHPIIPICSNILIISTQTPTSLPASPSATAPAAPPTTLKLRPRVSWSPPRTLSATPPTWLLGRSRLLVRYIPLVLHNFATPFDRH